MECASVEDRAQPAVLRFAAFANAPEGGNPAGIVLQANSLSVSEMQRIAAEVGYAEAAFTSVEPEIASLAPEVENELLAILGLSTDSLDEQYPLRVAFAGNWHPILVLKDQTVFDNFSFEPQALRALMDEQEWRGTVTVLHAISAVSFEARNLFPVGSMTEDPATGSAAASLGGYLRILRLVDVPCSVEVHQGSHVGRPSLLTVEIPEKGGITVSGSASEIA
ncbi:MAG: PhzF family phenazine biosynthesis protein [Leucobacter sp.]|jgi:PhzF family phenazine biosynthesis protein|nr:PhzF family phenazine biosynthesis protein [Leucobacter sp.]